MRLWSIHPQYLDAKGLVALWREGLLAQHVLAGKTKGYRHHPQLLRFKEHDNALVAIAAYLYWVSAEADKRDYNFNRTKIMADVDDNLLLTVTSAQLNYEFKHLYNKLKIRAPEKRVDLSDINVIQPHPLFLVTGGDIEPWEVC